jgi:predicted TIM-barrel fold metal-dependent hydrolase
VLTPAWRRFLDAHADRCLAGTDTYTPGRWADLAGLVEETRQWLAQLPEGQASRIAHGNAVRLFGPPGLPGTP